MMLNLVVLASAILIGPSDKLLVDANNKLLVNSGTPSPCSTGFYSPVTVNSGQVPSTQTNYPVRIYQTDARFKDVAHSGHVQSSSGFDIRPYSDAGCDSAITGYELAFYDGATGTVEMYVKRSSLADGNVTYLDYGDPSLTTDGSSTATWSNGFLGVYHLKDGTTLSVADSTASNNGTNHGATATTGQFDGGANFVSGSSQYVEVTNTLVHTAVTYSAWVNGTSFPAAFQAIVSKDNGTALSEYFIKSNGKIMASCSGLGGNTQYDGTGSHTLSTGTWYHVAMTYVSGTGLIGYVNGSSDGSAADVGQLVAGATSTGIGKDIGAAGRYWNGVLDEVRVSNVARSANWITTEYNEGFPTTFETLGSEVAR